jgi:hypothetical protein
MPFTYIERSTALRAVFQSEKLGVISNSDLGAYKSGSGTADIRQEIDVNAASNVSKPDTEIETLNQFAQKFKKGDLFKSASEICDLHIVPTGETVAGMPDFWNRAQLTGDNLRERIYTTLYPRLTTRSNTYTVHYRVQTLKEVPTGRTTAAQWATWDESKDKVLSECRGSTVIERYIDPNQSALTDDYLDAAYHFRVVSTQRFIP